MCHLSFTTVATMKIVFQRSNCYPGRELLAMLMRVTFLTFFLIATEAVATEQTIRFDIPRQSAGEALPAFGQQANVSVVYQYKLIENHETNRLQGKYTVERAVAILLRHSGLKAAFGEAGHLLIAKDDSQDIKGMKTKKIY